MMAQWILGAALLLGILGDALFRDSDGSGLNWLLWTSSAVGAAAVLARRQSIAAAMSGRVLIALALLFSGLMALRDSFALHGLCLLAIIVAAAGAVSVQEGWRAMRSGFVEYAKSVALLAGAAFTGPTRFMNAARGAAGRVSDGFIPRAPQTEDQMSQAPEGADRWVAAPGVARGLLIVAPLFVVFLALLMSADPAYRHVVTSLFEWDLQTLIAHLLTIAVVAWCAAGVLHRALRHAAEAQSPAAAAPLLTLGVPEVMTILTAIDLLFLSFVGVQLRYAFGGEALIRATTGLTYAEYARGGFFELLAVAAIVLPVLLFLHWALDRRELRAERPFQWLAGVQVSLLGVMLASAYHRMRLYEAVYGMTELRLYVMAAIVWLAVVFAWFCLTVLRGRRRLFAGGALAAAALGIGVLEGVNPDALIAKINLAQAHSAHRFDGCYAASLSADAVPPLVNALPTLAPADAAIVAHQLLSRWTPPPQIDWRGWSVGRAQAWNAVESRMVELRTLAAGAPKDACPGE
ncbi:hypothetical protein CCAX7_002130 [Capsulimonas corticalis]|uniref:Uncharacterized protein n=1 Tax=Capsulimonas corticalis TaxID=2219043 RepID=A0A402CRZ8_9BACT|nr:DUF4173 domain-containing protein [Capsulimonas corticalis]BDI28162.1 hypothetical protein CCAX7_002130 [Capsulimonas corticalis]